MRGNNTANNKWWLVTLDGEVVSGPYSSNIAAAEDSLDWDEEIDIHVRFGDYSNGVFNDATRYGKD